MRIKKAFGREVEGGDWFYRELQGGEEQLLDSQYSWPLFVIRFVATAAVAAAAAVAQRVSN